MFMLRSRQGNSQFGDQDSLSHGAMVCPQQISDDNDDDGVNIDNDDEEDAVCEAKSIDF